MFGTLSKALYAASFAALCAIVALGFIGGNRSGVVLLVFAGSATFFLGTVLVIAGVREAVVLDTQAISEIPADGRGVSESSLWPAIVAFALVGLGLSFVYGWGFSVAGVTLALLAIAGWTAMSLRENFAWTDVVSDRVRDRFTAPFAMPVMAAVAIAFVGIAVSRVLLAAPKTGSLVAAGLLAVVFLAGATFAVVAKRGPRLLPGLLLAVALVGVGAAGIAGLARGEREIPNEGALGKTPVIRINAAAEGNIYDTNRIVVPKVDPFTPRPSDAILAAGHNGAPFTLKISNANPLSHHNVSFYSSNPDAGGIAIFQGGWVAPGRTEKYEINSTRFVGNNAGFLDANPDDTERTYFWRCDIHPNMQGFVAVPSVNDVKEVEHHSESGKDGKESHSGESHSEKGE